MAVLQRFVFRSPLKVKTASNAVILTLLIKTKFIEKKLKLKTAQRRKSEKSRSWEIMHSMMQLKSVHGMNLISWSAIESNCNVWFGVVFLKTLELQRLQIVWCSQNLVAVQKNSETFATFRIHAAHKHPQTRSPGRRINEAQPFTVSGQTVPSQACRESKLAWRLYQCSNK